MCAPVTVPPKEVAVPPTVIALFANLAFAIEPANIALVTPLALTRIASESISTDESSTPTAKTPLDTAKPLPAKNVPNLETSVLFIVPASLIIISSVDAIAAFMSFRPETMLLFNIEPSTALDAIVNAPPAATVASPLTLPNIVSSKLENVIFSEPLSVASTIAIKSA